MPDGPSHPKVSVVVASYNRAELLVQAVESALSQGGPEIEVVVSDDCSPDNSVERLRALGDPRVRVNAQPRNVGVWLNWTAALEMARGDFVVFLGDDDFLGEGFLDSHLEAFCRNPQVSAVFSQLEDRPADPSQSKFYKPCIPVGVPSKGGDLIEGLLRGDFFFGAAMFRRDVAERLWQETREDDMVADWGLILGLATMPGATVTACDGCRYIKRIHRVRLSSKYVEISDLISKVCARFSGRCPDPAHRRVLLDRSIMEKVILSRHYAALGDMAKCRSILTSCLRITPLRPTILSQWLQAFVLPGRIIRTAREQRGLASPTQGA
jgi:glycosyltransferase involved in cell wall biosynthesis